MSLPRTSPSALVLCALLGCATSSSDDARAPLGGPPVDSAAPPPYGEGLRLSAEQWQARVDRYARPALEADVARLPDSERAALDAILEASRLLDPIYDRQVWEQNPELMARLAEDDTPAGLARLEYVRAHRGPWDRQEGFAPFAVDIPRPAGAGFYPPDMSAEEFHAWLERHPEDRPAFESPFTLIRREEDRLVAIPYREAFRAWLEPAAAKLREAAGRTQNESLARFLRLRADAFLSDDYFESDKAWMDLDSEVEVAIGPYEVYEDQLLGLKASYESFVTVADPEASAQLERFKALLPAMEQNLPVPDEAKTERGKESPIRVVDLVFTAGEARKSVQTIAFNLPNDERVRKEKGAKKVLLRNAIETKFDAILQPIGARLIVEDQQGALSSAAFFHQVLFHELSHSLGPAFTERDGERVEVRLALGSAYSPLEECKANVMGAYNLLYLMDEGEMPALAREELLVTYFTSLFRSVRFGAASAHGRGAAVQLGRILAGGGATFEEDSGRFRVQPAALQEAVRALVHDVVMIQHRGDKAAAEGLLAAHGRIDPRVQQALERLEGIPLDIRPIFPVAGESL